MNQKPIQRVPKHKRPDQPPIELIAIPKGDGDLIGIEVTLESMNLPLRPGDVAIVSTSRQPAPDDLCFVQLKDGRLMFRFVKVDGDVATVSTNTDNKRVPVKDLVFCYPVESFVRSLKSKGTGK